MPAEEGKRFQRLAPETERIIGAYDWPGNVRQLQNVLRNVVVLNDGEEVTPEMLPQTLTTPAARSGRPAAAAGAVRYSAPTAAIRGSAR